ncbi:MAG: hypothetical protein V3U84_11510 [Thiotrichaceae bacterium]
MSAIATAIVGTAIVGAAVQNRASKRSAAAQERAGREGISAQDRALEIFNERTQPAVNLGNAAGIEIANLLGLTLPDQDSQRVISDLETQLAGIDENIARFSGSELSPAFASTFGLSVDDPKVALAGLNTQRTDVLSQLEAARQPQAQPNRLGELEEINPLVSFLRDQGFEDIQESAAARGRLGAGGTLNELTEFNTNLASTVVPQLQAQRFNQLANILGIGTNAATGQGNAAVNTGVNTANLLGNIGEAQAGREVGRANAITNTLGNVAGAFGQFAGNRQGGNTAANQNEFVGGVQSPTRFEAFS